MAGLSLAIRAASDDAAFVDAAFRRMARHVHSYAEAVIETGGREEIDVP